MNIFLTPSQETAFARIGALPDCNTYGGPGLQGLAALRALPVGDRAPVLHAFASQVRVNMSPEQRLAIVCAITQFQVTAG